MQDRVRLVEIKMNNAFNSKLLKVLFVAKLLAFGRSWSEWHRFSTTAKLR